MTDHDTAFDRAVTLLLMHFLDRGMPAPTAFAALLASSARHCAGACGSAATARELRAVADFLESRAPELDLMASQPAGRA